MILRKSESSWRVRNFDCLLEKLPSANNLALPSALKSLAVCCGKAFLVSMVI
jgi:hypothetical protein